MSEVIIDETKAREDVISAGLDLIKYELIARTWGNISARISDTEFVITPSGKGYEDLTPRDLVPVNISDESYPEGVKPSSEKGVHAVLYAQHPEVNFIIHTHQNFATALSALGRDVRAFDKKYHDVLDTCVPCAAYGLSSTKKLRDNVAAAAGLYPDSTALLMQNHGAVCMGKDYDSAMKVALTLEEMCKEKYAAYTGEPVLQFTKEDTVEYSNYSDGVCAFVKSPYVVRASHFGIQKKIYVDDEAQYLGASIPCYEPTAKKSTIYSAAKRNGAVYIKGKGAICFSDSMEEADAIRMVLEKGSLAYCLALKTKDAAAVSSLSAELEHFVYKQKYSKLKNKK